MLTYTGAAVSVLSSGNETDQQQAAAGIGINDVGKDIAVPDPFVKETEASKTLIDTYRRTPHAC